MCMREKSNKVRVKYYSVTRIADFRAIVSRAKSLCTFQSLKSLFTASSHFNFGRHLPRFVFSLPFRIPLLTGPSGGLRWICPNHLLGKQSIPTQPNPTSLFRLFSQQAIICKLFLCKDMQLELYLIWTNPNLYNAVPRPK